jgi:hypothetical protein
MGQLRLLGLVVAGALAVAGAAHAGPMNGAASLAAVVSAPDQDSRDAVVQVRERRYSVPVSRGFRRNVDHGWHYGSYNPRAFRAPKCL